MTAVSPKTTGSHSPAAFVAKWSRVDLPERAASQEHFIDLCRLLGQPTPAEHDATGTEYAFEKGVEVVAGASKDLDEQRERWLNPPEWIGPIAARIDAADQFLDVPEPARPLIRQSAIMGAAARDLKLKKRTLTNLYNERPTWLRLAHEKLDRAVLAAYAAVDPKGGWDESWAEVWVETGAGQPLPAGHALAARRAEVEERVLANLLRLNQERAKNG
jgi:hypothetical protein